MAFLIVKGVPFWVWPLLAFLVWYGLRATRDREVPVWPFYVMPLIGVLSFNAVYGLGQGNLLWLVFVLAYFFGVFWGHKAQRRLILSRGEGRVTLSGEWVTFTLLMLVFWMNFAGGVAQAIAPEFYGSFGFALAVALVGGGAGGSFLGRSIGVILADRPK